MATEPPPASHSRPTHLPVVTWHFRGQLGGAAGARHRLRMLAFQWATSGLALADETAADVELMLSELITNAMSHGRGPVEVCIAWDLGTLRVEVVNEGKPSRRLEAQVADPHSLHGRGLHIVDTLADRWGSTVSATTTSVWFEVKPPPPPGLTDTAAD